VSKHHSERKVSIVPLIAVLLLCLLSSSLPFGAHSGTASAADSVFYDFITQAPSASWSSGAGSLPFPGSDSDSRGFALYRDSWQLEDNNTWARALETHPQWVSNGWIMGVYPQVTVPADAELKVTVGFFKGATGSDGVTFEVKFEEFLGLQVAPKIYSILSHRATYDGKLDSITTELSSIEGKTGNFVLYANAGQNSGQDWAAWAEAKIEAPSDTTAPEVTISHSPSEVTTADTVTFTAQARDDTGVAQILIFVNGQQVKECTSPSQKTDGEGGKYWECIYTGGPYDQGTLTYRAEAIDSYENQGVSSEESVDVTVTITPVEPPVILCLFSISGTIHNFWHDSTTLKIEVCEAETIMAEIGGTTVPITTCKEGGHVWHVDTNRLFSGDLPGLDLTYQVNRLCPGTYIVAPVYQPGADLCEWHGSWQTAKGQVVRIEVSNAEGFDFTFEPQDSHTPRVSSITANPEHPELSEDVVITILTQDDGEIAAIWEKTDIVFNDGSFHAGYWHSLTVSPGMLGSTAGAQFSLTDDRIMQATVRAKVCDSGGNSHMAQMTVQFGSCYDEIQNQGETGIDCGGPCPSQCKDCLNDLTIGTSPSAYLYNPEAIAYVKLWADEALCEYAHQIGISVDELDTSDEYIEAISWYVSLRMGYRGDGSPSEPGPNRICFNEVCGLGYEPSDYGHGDFPQPAYYTLCYSGVVPPEGYIRYTEKGAEKSWYPDASKIFYGDCDDYAILWAALLRSLGVSSSCVFNAEQPGHAFNIAYYKGKYRVIEPQRGLTKLEPGVVGEKYYAPDNLWNDKMGAFCCSDFDKVKPWQYTLNYPGCENPSVAVSGGGFGEKRLWLDWSDWGTNVKPGVADFNGDGRDDIAAVRVTVGENTFEYTDFRFLSNGSSFEKDFPESATGDSNWQYFEVESLGDSVNARLGTIIGSSSRVQRFGHVESPTSDNFVWFMRSSVPSPEEEEMAGDVQVVFDDATMPRLSIHDGCFSMEVSDVTSYDHWDNVDRAPQLQYDVNAGDWSVETFVRVSETSGHHHAGLMVYFSQYDIIYFGLFNSGSREKLVVQRSGERALFEIPYGDSASLKIEKVGTDYEFYVDQGRGWEKKLTITETEEPAKVGFILKTWSPTSIRAEFSYFRYEQAGHVFRDEFDSALSEGLRLYVPRSRWHGNFCTGRQIPFVGDFDGDGTDDIITFVRERDGSPSGEVYVAPSEPEMHRFGIGLLWHDNFCLGDEIPGIGDFNGDGRMDIVTFKQDTGQVFIALSTIFGFWGDGWLWKSDFCHEGETPLVGDFDGDGRDDIACLSVENGRARIWVALAAPSTISYDCHGGNICDQATFYTKAYWPDICR
jgi:hypothetical protein